MAIRLGAVASIGAGSLFVYAGLRGFSILKAAQNVIQGTSPNTGQKQALLSVGGSSGGVPVSTGAGGNLASVALSYVGKLTYLYGGPNPLSPQTVDCSSFASKCLNQVGYANPGGAKYDPWHHGPTTLNYLVWGGAQTVGHQASDAQENDLCVWQTHMGICIGNGQMVSARDPAEGVGVDPIAGDMPGEFLFVRRLISGGGGRKK